MVSPSSGVAIAVGRHRSRDSATGMPGRAYTGASVLVRSSLALVLVAALIAGCGGGSAGTTSATTATTSRAAAAFDDCLRPGPAVALVAVPAPGERLPAVVLGRGGSTGVVFANQSASSACGWLPYARAVARDGVRSVVFDYAAASREDEVLAAGAGCAPRRAARRARGGLDRRACRRHGRAHGGPRQVDAVVSPRARSSAPSPTCSPTPDGCASRRCGSAPRTTPIRSSQPRPASSTAARADMRGPTACSSSAAPTTGSTCSPDRRHGGSRLPSRDSSVAAERTAQ